jgi:hypothetical protein
MTLANVQAAVRGRCDARAPSHDRIKIVLYNPRAVFFTMPLALLAIGSQLDPEVYEVVIIDGRLDDDVATLTSHLEERCAWE